MREIKFRAWDKKKNGWVSRNEWLGGALSPSIDTISICSVWRHFNIEIMQYTGLKDKNGVEIYDGDIIKKDNDITIVKYSEYHTSFQVYYNLSMASRSSLYEFCYSSEIELIGNIYENPELLNKG